MAKKKPVIIGDKIRLKHKPFGRLKQYNVEVTGNGEIVSRFYIPEKGGRAYEYRVSRNIGKVVKVDTREWFDITPHEVVKHTAANELKELA